MPSISFFHPFQGDWPLPPSIQRQYIPTPSGSLELLVAEPKHTPATPAARKQPLFFAHGGCGGAAVWVEWMDYFSQQHDIPCYAVSYRGHGSSWYPWYWRMYFTTMRTLGGDLLAGIRAAEQLETAKRAESVRVVLVGHSSGGGLSQMILDAGQVEVSALALMAAIPIFGSADVNSNWARLDPWFVIRMLFKHFGHPMSPLSSTALVKQAFFCIAFPTAKVIEFEKRMPRYESYLWPMGQMFRIAQGVNVVRNIIGWGASERIAVIAAGEDKLIPPDLCDKTATEYRVAFEEAVRKDVIEAKVDEVVAEQDGSSIGLGVRYHIVKGAGHHVQNDLQSEDAALKLLDFYQQL